jgi:hypothetical protein
MHRVRFGTQEYGRYRTALPCTALHCPAPHCPAPHRTAPHRTALHCRHRLAMVCIERKQTLEAEEQVL